jgi:hypothetical protein
LVEDIMKLENELHTVENFDVIKKKEIWSKTFEIGNIAGLLYQIKNAVGWRGRKAMSLSLIKIDCTSRKQVF